MQVIYEALMESRTANTSLVKTLMHVRAIRHGVDTRRGEVRGQSGLRDATFQQRSQVKEGG